MDSLCVCVCVCVYQERCVVCGEYCGVMETAAPATATATVKDGDEDSGVGSLNGQSVVCVYIPKLDIKVT